MEEAINLGYDAIGIIISRLLVYRLSRWGIELCLGLKSHMSFSFLSEWVCRGVV